MTQIYFDKYDPRSEDVDIIINVQLQGKKDDRKLLPEEIDSLIIWLTGVRQQIDNAQKEGRK